MKVVFLEEVFGTAVPGEVKEVKNGFARNYLLPRGLAVPATKSAMQQADALSKKEEKRQAQLDSDAQKLIEKLEGQQITITARVGEQGRLYGSVTSADIAAKLATVFDGEFDRRRVLLPAPIREVGSHPVTIRLTRNVSHQMNVEVEPEEGSRRRVVATEPLPPIIPDVEPEEFDEDDDEYEE